MGMFVLDCARRYRPLPPGLSAPRPPNPLRWQRKRTPLATVSVVSDTEKVRVFISWSGEGSKGVAQALRVAIDDCFDLVTPFMSDSDIEGGQRGLRIIEEELNSSQFGIIVVTKANMSAPWLNFEAGAISKVLHGDDTRVIPLLVDVPTASELLGPMAQFQAKKADRNELGLVFGQIGKAAGIEADKVARRFEGAWPMIDAAVEAASAVTDGEELPGRSTESMVAEVLELVRGLRRDAGNSPESSLARSWKKERAFLRSVEMDNELISILIRHGFSAKTAHLNRQLGGGLEILLDAETTEQEADMLRDDLREVGIDVTVGIYPF